MSGFVDSSTTAREHCDSMSALHPDLSSAYSNISSIYSRKLWHQLTQAVLDFTSDTNKTLRSTAEGGNSYLALYDRIVQPIDKKINPLSLARIASSVANSLLILPAVPGTEGGDGVAAQAVLENLLEKRSQLGPAASLFTESKLSLLQLTQIEKSSTPLSQEELKKQLEHIKEMIKTGTRVLASDIEEGSDTLVHSAFYEASMMYRKAVGPPEAFYQQAMLYLNHTPLEHLTSKQTYNLATDIGLAALTGDGVFNFGEVCEQPILQCLMKTDHQWLYDLLHIFASGNIDEFRTLTSQYDAQIRAQPALVSRAESIQEKITLLAFVDMVFQRPSAERTFDFEEIAQKIGVPVDQVEWIVMRATSLGLVRSTMDQVDANVTVTWVIPRVLNKEQMTSLATRFGEWAEKVGKARDYMGDQQTPALA